MNKPATPPKGNIRLIVVICAIVAAWGIAMIYRRPLQARYLALRAQWASDPQTQSGYVLNLLAFGPDGLGAIEQLLRSDDAGLRALAVMDLQHSEEARALALLRDALKDPDPTVRRSAIVGLGFKGDPAVIEPLRELAGTADPFEALQAIAALQRIKDRRATQALIDVAKTSPALLARAHAIDALATIVAKSAVPELIDLLGDEQAVAVELPADRIIRKHALTIKQRLRQQGFDPDMIQIPSGPRKTTIADLAADALRRITGRSFGYTTTAPADRKQAIIRMWRNWYARPHPT